MGLKEERQVSWSWYSSLQSTFSG